MIYSPAYAMEGGEDLSIREHIANMKDVRVVSEPVDPVRLNVAARAVFRLQDEQFLRR